ncbi:hypothetical protein HPP92_019549 [Vanilla planifolia]|uniref:Uncharacterized protein n=1 Tax=Vanilla planifolia TaxID=51239 RepID=A0A835ULT9_VANPL|nr:hypothetical protein HPP92_019549 [Vanilla planifolia]
MALTGDRGRWVSDWRGGNPPFLQPVKWNERAEELQGAMGNKTSRESGKCRRENGGCWVGRVRGRRGIEKANPFSFLMGHERTV